MYRKYRSKSFDEVVGQEHVTQTLKKALESGRISHAYLFTGPMGVGKTSVARILAHVINNIPYEGEETHLDIIEIDAASNRRIDEIRDLRERVRIAPASAKYKVYIIDEVHMLTREAFNALLKTLEEPPAHIIFILATTEAHKLPETIVSRTQRFEFKPINAANTQSHLKDIAKRENINISPEAIDLLAEFGNGSFRDSLSYLDQLSSSKEKISEDEVRRVLGLPSSRTIKNILSQVKQGASHQVLESLEELKSGGLDAAAVASALSKQIRADLITAKSDAAALKLLKSLIDVPASPRPFDYLEICLLEACNEYGPKPGSSPKASPKTSQPAQIRPETRSESVVASAGSFDLVLWPKIVSTARDRAASLYTALKLAEPEFVDSVLVLKFQFPLHQKKLEQAKNKDLLSEIIESMTGAKVKIECLVDKQAFNNRPKHLDDTPVTESSPISSINNIFGAAEVLEA